MKKDTEEYLIKAIIWVIAFIIVVGFFRGCNKEESPLINYKDFAKEIKIKYPEYSSINDKTLVYSIIREKPGLEYFLDFFDPEEEVITLPKLEKFDPGGVLKKIQKDILEERNNE
ncbi:MAG: hypothetical protein LBR69_03180 [Endomicrobium sp.]|jgi:hypothetical protein|nr:hypothetical protein [Endomicrobium sp.]